MSRLWKWMLPGVVIAAIFGGVFAFASFERSAPFRDGVAPDSRIVWSHGHDGSSRNAEEHWRKHGAEFPEYHNAQDYEIGARAFTQAPPPGTEVKHRSNGDTLFYNSATNTFAVADKNGRPRTYFRPSNGAAYWDRQGER